MMEDICTVLKENYPAWDKFMRGMREESVSGWGRFVFLILGLFTIWLIQPSG